MRRLLKYEKEIISLLVKARNENKYDRMQVAYILRHFVTYDYICFDKKTSKLCLKTFLHGNKGGKDLFYRIVDIIGFFEELKKRGFVLVEKISYKNIEYPRYHYDDNKFIYTKKLGLNRKNDSLKLPVEEEGDEVNIYYGKIIDVIEKYMDSIVYPLQPLIDYKRHSYRTIEQRRFCCTTIIGILAIIVAILISLKSDISNLFEKNKQFSYEEIMLKIDSAYDAISPCQYNNIGKEHKRYISITEEFPNHPHRHTFNENNSVVKNTK